MRALLNILFLTIAVMSIAAAGEVVTRVPRIADQFEGSEYRDVLQDATELEDAGDREGAWKALRSVLDYCESELAKPGVLHVSVSNQEELAQFSAEHEKDGAIAPIDMACPMAYKMAAFFYVSDRQAVKAYAFLDKAQQLAPYWADPYSERAYTQRLFGDNISALATYQAGLALTLRYESATYMRPILLRGIGYIQIELGNLAEARKVYEESLQLDPGNEIATSELDYINQLEVKQRVEPDDNEQQADDGEVTKLSRDQVVPLVRFLEREPNHENAPAIRSLLIQWEDTNTEFTDYVCEGILDPVPGDDIPNSGELLVQFIFGSAAYQLETAAEKRELVAAQTAGMRSMFKAYQAFLAADDTAHIPRLDELLRMDTDGKFEAHMAEIVPTACGSLTEN